MAGLPPPEGEPDPRLNPNPRLNNEEDEPVVNPNDLRPLRELGAPGTFDRNLGYTVPNGPNDYELKPSLIHMVTQNH